jgi:hypothetical protein
MKALYLYCVRNTKPGSGFKIKGINSLSKITTIQFNGIEAVVSEINAKEFSSKQVREKAQQDISWIIKRAEEHEKVIEAAMKTGAVIPMKFGIIFKNKERLIAEIKNQALSFARTLEKLKHHNEYGVKAYVREKSLKLALKTKTPALKAKLKKAGQLPKGMDYLKTIDIGKDLDELSENESAKRSKLFFKTLASAATQAKENNCLSRELSGKREPMVLNSAYLVQEKKVNKFKKTVQELKKKNPEFIIECTGPWPAYNFIS